MTSFNLQHARTYYRLQRRDLLARKRRHWQSVREREERIAAVLDARFWYHDALDKLAVIEAAGTSDSSCGRCDCREFEDPKMIRKAFITGHHPYAFRGGQTAEIIGVVMCAPNGLSERPCFHVRFPDGVEDFIPLSDYAGLALSRAGYAIKGAEE